MQKENLFFFSFSNASNFEVKLQSYEEVSKMQKENKEKSRNPIRFRLLYLRIKEFNS